jgi:penicillin-binding protein 2
LNLRQALQHSCNVYFYRLALAGGYEPIYHMAAALGLGVRTDISLDYEAPGILPDDAWKRRRGNEGWRDGDTCNLAIGQGFLTATPLQMAMVTAALANGGRLYRPRLVGRSAVGASGYHTIPPHVVNDLGWIPPISRWCATAWWMWSTRPTARQTAYILCRVAGKTGTAEYGRKGEGHKYG